jgi:Ca2+-binding RTX toxin-like protein
MRLPRTFARVAAATTIACFAAPGAASASSVSVNFGVLDLIGASGETNRVTVAGSGGTIDVTDTGAPLVAGDNCARLAGSITVRCEIPAGLGLILSDLRDGNDALTINRGFPALVEPGLGNDTINGGPVRDEISGGAGDDVIDGRGGDDSLQGNAGGDTITGGPGTDGIQGQAGPDDIRVRDGEIDTVGCGIGADVVDPDPFDDLAFNC